MLQLAFGRIEQLPDQGREGQHLYLDPPSGVARFLFYSNGSQSRDSPFEHGHGT